MAAYVAGLGQGLLTRVREAGPRALAMLETVQEELWTRAVPEQQRLTIQLCRNSLYFLLSGVLIRFFGDQLAI